MGHCPACQAELGDDFGVVNCPSCGVVLVVDLDGQATLGQSPLESESDEAAVPPLPGVEDSNEFVPVTDENEAFASFESPEDQALPSEQESGEFSSDMSHAQPDMEPDPSVGDFGEAASHSLSSEELPQDAEAILNEGLQPQVSVPEVASSPALSDIQEFANSELSQGKDGLLLFNVKIEGIDSADVRADLKEVLNDAKFLWDVDELMRSIRNGQLMIERLSSVKASVLVSRLKVLPVKVSWEQHAVFDS